MTIQELKEKVLSCDENSYFINDKMYSDISTIELLNHNCFHLIKAVAKLADFLEKNEHNVDTYIEKSKIYDEVIPDLIIYAIQFANRLEIDVESTLENRIIETIEKYDRSAVSRKRMDRKL